MAEPGQRVTARRNLFGDEEDQQDESTSSQRFLRGVTVRRRVMDNSGGNNAGTPPSAGGGVDATGNERQPSVSNPNVSFGVDRSTPNGQVNSSIFNRNVFLPNRENPIEVNAVIENDPDAIGQFGDTVQDGDGNVYASPVKTPVGQTFRLQRDVSQLNRMEGELRTEKRVMDERRQHLREVMLLQQRLSELQQERDDFREELRDAYVALNTINETRDPSAPEKYRLKDALHMIREFSGENPQKLEAFLSQCATARDAIRPEMHNQLLQMIMGTKLEGKALLQLKHTKITSFEQLKTELEALFGTSKSLLEWQVEFNRLQQRENEDVSKFAARAERITAELVAAIQGANPDSSDMVKEGVKLGIFTLAKANFEQGLRGQVQVLVRAANHKTLHESCLGAVALEKTISAGNSAKGRNQPIGQKGQNGQRQSFSRQSLGSSNCFSCGLPGHLQKDCKNAQQRRSVLPTAVGQSSVAAYSAVCKFCGFTGHDFATCRRLRKKLNIGESGELKLLNKNNENKSSNQQNTHNSSNEGNNKKKNNNSYEKLPVGAFQIMTVTGKDHQGGEETSTGSAEMAKKRMITAARPEELKNKLFLSADELKKPTVFLADSGATTSVVKLGCLKEGVQITQEQRILRGIADQDVPTLGSVVLYLKIGDEELGHVFQVVPADFPCANGILGEDFLESPDISVQKDGRDAIIINGNRMPLLKGEPVLVGARTEALVWAPTRSTVEGIARKRELQPGVFMGESLTKPVDGRAIVCVVNTTAEDIFLEMPAVKLEGLPSGKMLPIRGKTGTSSRERMELLRQNLRLDHLGAEEKESVLKLLEEFNDVVQLPGDSPGMTDHLEHEIPTKPGEAPVNVRPHRLPDSQREEVNRQVQEMLDSGVIRPSKSPWNAPLLVVPKKMDASGRIKVRVVVDFRRLNDITIGEAFPLPNISDILDRLGKAVYFTTLDLASGFHQVPVKEEDREKTAFSTPYGHFEFNRLPFGVKGGPTTFQRLMNSVLAGMLGLRCFVYLDDIVVFGASLQEHNDRLREVLERLRAANLRLQPDKCNFLRREVVYLGHVISSKGVKADPSKIEAVKNFPVPVNVKGVMSFLGLAGYYRKFIQNFSNIAKPLTELTKKDVVWKWGEQQQGSFEELQKKLTEAPILQYPDFSKPFLLTTDASNRAIGAILSQGEVNRDLPIAYASRTLNKAEMNYSTIERELLAIVWGVKHFRPYLYGRKFIIVTDHQPLKWIFSVKDPGSRLMHWRLLLEGHEYEVIHKPGKDNTNADALSRVAVVTHEERNAAGSNDSGSKQKTPAVDEIPILLREYHDTPFSGHPGQKRMLERLKMNFNWEGMRKDVEQYVASCKQCQLNKLGRKTKVPMVVVEPPQTPFELCAMDIVGPLTETDFRHKYILTFQDMLTKFSRAIPVPDQEANTVARAFVEEIICQQGTPQKLLTDKGTNFLSQIFKDVCKLLKIKKIQTTAYHPQTNGALERSHRTLAEFLRSFIAEDQTDWDTWLPYATFVYNTTPHCATRYTPFELLYGRQMVLPTSLKQEPAMTYSADNYAQEVKERMRAMHSEARSNVVDAKLKAKENYDKNADAVDFNVGDLVLLKNETVRRGRSTKLTQPWIGPYQIVEKNSDVNFTIRFGNKKKTQRVHANRLRLFVDA